jgi:hypothetical protein
VEELMRIPEIDLDGKCKSEGLCGIALLRAAHRDAEILAFAVQYK